MPMLKTTRPSVLLHITWFLSTGFFFVCFCTMSPRSSAFPTHSPLQVCESDLRICGICTACATYPLKNMCVAYEAAYIIDNSFTPIFAFGMALWSSAFLDMWERTRSMCVSYHVLQSQTKLLLLYLPVLLPILRLRPPAQLPRPTHEFTNNIVTISQRQVRGVLESERDDVQANRASSTTRVCRPLDETQPPHGPDGAVRSLSHRVHVVVQCGHVRT